MSEHVYSHDFTGFMESIKSGDFKKNSGPTWEEYLELVILIQNQNKILDSAKDMINMLNEYRVALLSKVTALQAEIMSIKK